MPFTPGTSGNNAGRPKGSGNKINQHLRETITNFLEDNFQKVVDDFANLNPKDRVKFYCDLLQYGLPKLQMAKDEVDLSTFFDDVERIVR